MKDKGTKTIETERLILRKFTNDDICSAYRNWTSDELVTEYLRWPTHKDISVTDRVINDWIASYEDPAFYQWAIELKRIGEPIGTISVVEMNEKLEIVHIGYCIGSKWWHQGITSEAFIAIITFLFEEVGVNRIESQHDPNNPHSGNVMKKCGLKYEGTLRQADYSNQGIVDACMYSLLREEYFNRKYEFQLADYDDIFEIVSLYHRLIGTPGCTWDLDYPSKETAENDIKNDWLYTLKKNGKIVAVVSVGDFDELRDLQWKPNKPCELARIGVDPSFQKQGIGTIMLKNIIRIVKEKGYDGISMLVSKTNTAALALYEKNGFERCGEVFRFDNDFYCYQITF